MDSHADTCVLGADALVVQDFMRPVTVAGYDPSQPTQTFRTVSGVLAHVDPNSGGTYHLLFHQAIHIPHLDHHLLCPFQCRENGLLIDEVPKFQAQKPTETSHSIVAPVHEEDEVLTMPLYLDGITSYLSCFSPTMNEWASGDYPVVEMTSPDVVWEPSDERFAAQEAAMYDAKGYLASNASARGPSLVINQMSSTFIGDTADITDNDNLGSVLESYVSVSSVDSSNSGSTFKSRRMPGVDHMTLAKRWNVPPDRAKQTVGVTTQRGVRQCLGSGLTRRYPTNDRMLRYNRLRQPVFTDTLIAGTTSWRPRCNNYSQVFATNFGWTRAHGMRRKGEAHEALSLLFQREGVPPEMIADCSKEQTLGDFKRKCKEAACYLKPIEPYSPWMNSAEVGIRETKRGTSRKMIKTGSPKRLWDHALELEALVRSHTALPMYRLDGQTPETIMTGETPDISHICEFAWYDWLMFKDRASFPSDDLVLGRYLGPAIDVGSALCAKILKSNGEIVYRSTYRHLTPEERESAVHKAQCERFDVGIFDAMGAPAIEADFPDLDITPEFEEYEDDDGIEGSPDAEVEEPTPEASDNYLNAELMLPRGSDEARGRVVARKRDAQGNVVGRASDNPILDSRLYLVEFDDGQQAELAANVIAQSIYAQCDPDGNQYLLLDSFVDFEKDGTKAIALTDQVTTRNGRQFTKKSTIGWRVCCQWKDGSTSWQKLSDLKESHPVQVAEYAVAQGIDHEPAFNWWVSHVLKKRDRIISLVKQRNARYLKRTHKFGIELPKTVKEALAIDNKNGNTYWQDAIAKEMKNVRVAFEILGDGTKVPVGHQRINCHMVFDIKMEDFRRKARLVAGGHTTDAPAVMTYASVVSRESVRLALTLAALNNLQLKAGDVLNAYITAPCKEKIWTVLGPEFGEDAGKRAVIVRALYGLKSAGAAFRSHLAECMRQIGYKPCLADPDIWMKAEVRDTPSGPQRYWSYILCYVDDILVAHHDAMSVLSKIDKFLPLKEGSVGDPSIYLGTKLRENKLANGVFAWSMSPSKYVQEAVENCEKHLESNFGKKYALPSKAANPFPTQYEPEMDVSEPLCPEEASYFQSLIGQMRWMVEIGRIDIATEISLLSSHLAYPREGHMHAALHTMAHLKQRHNTRMVFDPTYPDIDHDSFHQADNATWKEQYGDVREALPPNMPEALGKPVDLRLFVDSDHAGDKSIRRSRTGYMVFVNNALVAWLSKRQPTIETSVFGAEFVALKHGLETCRGLRYKLRMMGVPLDTPNYVYGDNQSVVTNSSKPESQLRKKSNSICYHFARESVAMMESMITHISTHNNWADLLTKVCTGLKRKRLVRGVLYDIYDDDHVKWTSDTK